MRILTERAAGLVSHWSHLSGAGLSSSDVDYWEVNEAFSVVDLANQQLLSLEPDR
jgi:acetyl-CoA acetyltransferase